MLRVPAFSLQPSAETVARGNVVPEEDAEASSPLHQAGANTLPKGVPEPRHTAAAKGDRIRGAQVLAPEESEGRQEPHLATSAFI